MQELSSLFIVRKVAASKFSAPGAGTAKEAVIKLDLPLKVEYITDMEKIMEYGVMRMPALVVNEKVVSMGKILKTADIEKLLRG